MEAKHVSVKRRLIGTILVTSLSGLALACIVLLAYELRSYRIATSRSLQTIAQIIAENSSAVLLYDDRKLAAEILSGLRVEPEISGAVLYDKAGDIYASYPGEGAGLFPAHPGPDGVTIRSNELWVFQPVLQGNARVGTLYLHGSLRGTYQRLRVYGFVLVGVLLAAGSVALIVSNFLQRRISEPLSALAKTARLVSENRDYTVRATQKSNDEFGDLTIALNKMLDEIQTSNTALREGEERFRALADNIAQLAWMADGDGVFKWFNKRWYDYTGENPKDGLSPNPDRVHPDHVERVRAKLQACFSSGQVWEDTFPLRGAEGQYRWFLSHAVPIRDESDKVIRWFGTNTDVTELRDTQQKLKVARDEAVAASRAKDDFLAKLSHELRTPLNPVLLLVSDSRRAADLPEDLQADFEVIRKNVELEARLIDDLLDLTSITRGKLVLERRALSLNSVIRDALTTITPEFLKRKVSVALELDERDPHVYGDAVRLQQVFWNLLKNGVKFSPPGSVVTVRTSLINQGLGRVEVIDRGMGMVGGEIARVFEAFVQGDHASPGGSHQFGGLGLGLAISRMLVELHSGNISAASEGLGKGSVFAVELPLLDADMKVGKLGSAAPFQGPVIPAATEHTIHTLVVEDHEPTRTTLERLLLRRGYDVMSASTVSEARIAASRVRIHLLISDIGLPDGSGYDLMREFKQAFGVTGIAITGYGMEGDIASAAAAGFLTHLTKPVRVQELETALVKARRVIGPQLGNVDG